MKQKNGHSSNELIAKQPKNLAYSAKLDMCKAIRDTSKAMRDTSKAIRDQEFKRRSKFKSLKEENSGTRYTIRHLKIEQKKQLRGNGS